MTGNSGSSSSSAREPIDFEFLRGRGEPFTLVKSGADEYVVNLFQVQVSSQTRSDVTIEFKLSELFIRFPNHLLISGTSQITLETIALGASGEMRRAHELMLIGPQNQ